MPRPVAVVGDIHGVVDALRLAITWLDEDWNYDVVFVGDYVNRGPDSRLVLDELVALKHRWGKRLTLLLGNHDAVLLSFLEGESRSQFLHHGGLQTVNSYLPHIEGWPQANPIDAFVQQFPEEHFALLRDLSLAYESDDVLVTHAGYNPERPSSRSPNDVVFGRHAALFAGRLTTPKSVVVCGHYVQRTHAAYVTDNFGCIDSGCGSVSGAPLSVFTFPDRQVKTFYGER
jgi:serine/threonine protein phosphatase 1